MIEPDARLVDEAGHAYRPTPSVHLVSSDEIVLSTGTGFRCVRRGQTGRIPTEVAHELVADGWLEPLKEEAAAEHTGLADLLAEPTTATLVLPASLAGDTSIERCASTLRRQGWSVVLVLQTPAPEGADDRERPHGRVGRQVPPREQWEEISVPGLQRVYRRR